MLICHTLPQAPPHQLVLVALSPDASLKQVLLKMYRDVNHVRKLPCVQASGDPLRIVECNFAEG